jgi:DNA helicase HerA-like ATPase
MIIIGHKKPNPKAAGYLGKVVISPTEPPVLGKDFYIDLSTSHVILLAGKRGYGKSYTLGVIVEEFCKLPYDIRRRLAVIVIDTVGIFWTLKYPNKEQEELLKKWNLNPRSFENVKILVPKGKFLDYYRNNLVCDGYFGIKPSELEIFDWLSLFGLSMEDKVAGILIEALENLKGKDFDLKDLLNEIENLDYEKNLKVLAKSLIKFADSLGIFYKESPPIKDLVKPGEIIILDVSTYQTVSGSQSIREVIVGILGKKLFEYRMFYRKIEEQKRIKGEKVESDMPLIWMIIDEAHLFVPNDRKSISRDVIIDWIRVGRQPGLSLILATQRLDKIDENVISQCDIFIAHRLTSLLDLEALENLKPSYVQYNLKDYISKLPTTKGLAVVLDDVTEKLWLIQVRPRESWHGGGSPRVI